MTFPSWVYRKEGFCKRIWVQTDVLLAFPAEDVPRLPLALRLAKNKKAGDAAQRSGFVEICGTQLLHMTPSRLLGPAMPVRSKAVSLHSPHIK